MVKRPFRLPLLCARLASGSVDLLVQREALATEPGMQRNGKSLHMSSIFKTAVVTAAAVIAQATLALFAVATPAAASAEILRFWEDEASKPSVTGRPAKSASSKRTRAVVSDNADDEASSRKPKRKKVRVASLGGNDVYEPRPSRKSLSGGGSISWAASSGCLNGTLVSLLRDVAASYGPLTVSSTCRSHRHNASVGGAKKSYHLTGDAADFRVHGNRSGAMAFLRSNGSVGGFHHYGGGLFHIDTGPKRTW
jgi:hypothetical protein